MKVAVRSGDIGAVEADALITAINSSRAGFGGIDGVIMRRSGTHFHAHAAKRHLEDGDAFLVAGPPAPGSFRHVVFVVDDLKRPLAHIVLAGLQVATHAKCKTVSMPAIRMGVMRGMFERSDAVAAAELAFGIREFTRNPGSVKELNVVVYQDPAVFAFLSESLTE